MCIFFVEILYKIKLTWSKILSFGQNSVKISSSRSFSKKKPQSLNPVEIPLCSSNRGIFFVNSCFTTSTKNESSLVLFLNFLQKKNPRLAKKQKDFPILPVCLNSFSTIICEKSSKKVHKRPVRAKVTVPTSSIQRPREQAGVSL